MPNPPNKNRRRIFLEDIPCLRIEDIRRMVGGKKKLNLLERVTAFLPDGRSIELELVRRPGNLGGSFALLACPVCTRPSRTLRLFDETHGLACPRCLQQNSIRYRSQLQLRRPNPSTED